MTDLVALPGGRDTQILLVEDNDANSALMRQILVRAGYEHVEVLGDANDVVDRCLSAAPDLLILDLHMPGMSGYDVLAQLEEVVSGPPYLPVLVVTADATPEAKRRALTLGATDFLIKPVDSVEVLLRTGNLLRANEMRNKLNEMVYQRTAELEGSRLETLHCLALAGEYRDDATGWHTQRVGHTSGLIALSMGLDERTAAMIRGAAPLHDVGKIGVADAILLKPGRLSEDETELMRLHVDIGAKILSGGFSPELRLARQIAQFHHERWDGAGYLRGLRGDEIPVGARITAVADVFDALSHARPYKQPWPLSRAVEEILSQRGRQFDPAVVDAFAGLDHAALIDAPRALQAGRMHDRVAGA